jgi:hypothetical protein
MNVVKPVRVEPVLVLIDVTKELYEELKSKALFRTREPYRPSFSSTNAKRDTRDLCSYGLQKVAHQNHIQSNNLRE